MLFCGLWTLSSNKANGKESLLSHLFPLRIVSIESDWLSKPMSEKSLSLELGSMDEWVSRLGLSYLQMPCRVMFFCIQSNKINVLSGFLPDSASDFENCVPASSFILSPSFTGIFFFGFIRAHLQKDLPFCTASIQVTRFSNWQKLIFEPAAKISVWPGVEVCSEYFMANPALSDLHDMGEFYYARQGEELGGEVLWAVLCG